VIARWATKDIMVVGVGVKQFRTGESAVVSREQINLSANATLSAKQKIEGRVCGLVINQC
jgi:hypothetical protein